MLALVCYALTTISQTLVKCYVFRNKENIFNSWLLVTVKEKFVAHNVLIVFIWNVVLFSHWSDT